MHIRHALCFFFLFLPALSARGQQLVDGNSYSLNGTVVRIIRETEAGLLPFVAIELAEPVELICNSTEDLCENEIDQSLLQLVIRNDEQWAIIEASLNSSATLSGMVFHSHTIHHMTPILLMVDTIDLGHSSPNLGKRKNK